MFLVQAYADYSPVRQKCFLGTGLLRSGLLYQGKEVSHLIASDKSCFKKKTVLVHMHYFQQFLLRFQEPLTVREPYFYFL